MSQWYKSYVKTLNNNGDNLLFFVMYRENSLAAIFPLETFERPIGRTKMKLRGLKIPHPWDTPFGDFIYEKEAANKQLLNELLANLGKYLSDKWDYIQLPQRVFENSSIWYSIRDDHSAFIHSQKQGGCYYLQAESYDQIREKFSRKFKRNLRQQRNKLSRLGNSEILFLRTKNEINWAFQDFIELEGSGWKGDEGSSIKNNQTFVKFFEELRDNFSEDGQFEIELLRVNNKSVAGLLCLLTDDTVYALKIGYDENYSSVSPGVLLLDEVIQRYSNDASVKTINFMADYASAEPWQPLSMDVFSILICNKSLLGLLYSINLKHKISEKVKKALMFLKKGVLRGRRANQIPV